ncbi:MAG: hypothetical protein ACXWT1_05190 [Methylobacter sp.]
MSKYVGWIPTLIGNLSYTLAGRSNYPYSPNVCIFENAGTFHYIISQKRVCHDSQMGLSSLIPSKKIAKQLEAFILEKKGIYSVWEAVLIGSCQYHCEDTPCLEAERVGKNFQNLQGSIIFIPRIPKIQKTKKIVKVINNYITQINRELWSAGSSFSSEEAFKAKEALSEILNEVSLPIEDNFSLLRCQFSLQRNGICFLKKLERFERDIDSTGAYNAEEIDELQYLTKSQAYNQIFYFIKDIFHTHKFHSADYDTLTQAYEFNDNDNINWAKETLKDFYRTAIRIEPEESLGIIYYSRAFKDIIVKDKILTPDKDEKKFNDGYSFFDENSVSDKSAEDVCKTRVDTKKRLLDTKKWQAGLFFTALLFTWNKANENIFDLLKISDNLKLIFQFIIPISISWIVLIYVEKISLSKRHEMIKFIKYLSSISSFYQIITLSGVLIVGIFLYFVAFYWKAN